MRFKVLLKGNQPPKTQGARTIIWPPRLAGGGTGGLRRGNCSTPQRAAGDRLDAVVAGAVGVRPRPAACDCMVGSGISTFGRDFA